MDSSVRSKRLSGLVLLGLAALSACSSHQDNVCQDIGDCAQGGSSDWITACQAEAKALTDEALSAGCSSELDSYFTCADSNFVCQGATAVFPGCAARLTALDACLAAATADTSCVRLAMQEATCSASTPDGGALGTPPACTAARDCQARCYLDNVATVCAPRVDELQNVSACASSCPP
jgi:hypothetical protein